MGNTRLDTNGFKKKGSFLYHELKDFEIIMTDFFPHKADKT